MNRLSALVIFETGFLLCTLATAQAGTALSVNNLYYTGSNAGSNITGTTIGGGNIDPHWSVAYASVGGVEKTQYEGAAYVISGSYVNAAWTPNTGTAKWITPPGALNNSGIANKGGDLLPGAGTTGAYAATYVYSLTFTIKGNAGDADGSIVTNQTSISLALSADDTATTYINPTYNADHSLNTSSAVGISNTWPAYDSTHTMVFQNFDNGTNPNNAVFKIGVNTIVVQVTNTGGFSGTQSAQSNGPSGLLVYQVGAGTIVSATPTPEVGAWLPVLGALGLFYWRRRSCSQKPASIA